MGGKREEKREGLKAALIGAAQARIREHGLAGLRARDVTADAGAALGSLYNAFQDLDELVLHVNSITLGELGAVLADAAASAARPEERLRALARGYLHFALENRALWAALFEHRMPEGRVVPDWHLAEHAVLFRHIVEPLAMLEPDLSEEQLVLRARTAFAAVHGIVAISIEERFIGLPKDQLEAELDRFTALLAAGVRASRDR